MGTKIFKRGYYTVLKAFSFKKIKILMTVPLLNFLRYIYHKTKLLVGACTNKRKKPGDIILLLKQKYYNQLYHTINCIYLL